MTEFNAYHKIPSSQKFNLPGGAATIQHKLDGSNAGIERQGNALIVHTRKTPLARIVGGETEMLGGGNAGFASLVGLVQASDGALLELMEERGVAHIYGEWLVPHKIKYPEGMYRKFYAYDLVMEEGHYAPVEPIAEALLGLGFRLPEEWRYFLPEGGVLPRATLREITLKLQEQVGYPIEGSVVKYYLRDRRGERNKFGGRHAYKDVLPEFQESKGIKVRPEQGPVESQLAAALPERAIEKRYLDVVAANGGRFEGKLIPQVLGRVWNDFITEFLDGGLRDLKYPQALNTRELKRLVDQRSREFALAYVSEEAA